MQRWDFVVRDDDTGELHQCWRLSVSPPFVGDCITIKQQPGTVIEGRTAVYRLPERRLKSWLRRFGWLQ